MKITFLGATREVTGSKYLIEHERTNILIDCGLYQGTGDIKQHNWDTLGIDPAVIHAIVLTHAHLDHVGYIPFLVKHGFAGKIYGSHATVALASVVLKDSGAIQRDDAKKAQSSGNTTAEPLYLPEDVEKSLLLFQPVAYDTQVRIGSMSVTLIQSNHILGSSFVILSSGHTTISFSGDLGRPHQLIMKSPPQLQQTDYLVLESTYGDAVHPQGDPFKMLADVVLDVIQKKGVLIIPAFAIERTQLIIYCLYQLRLKNIIPHIPIYLDSPMAIRVTNLFAQFPHEHSLSAQEVQDFLSIVTVINTLEESKQIDHIHGPAIIMAGSGMADGGRVVNHFAHYISSPQNTVLFVGFQAEGTRGKALLDGADTINVFDTIYPVRATIKGIDIFSAHADSEEIISWLSSLQKAPQTVFLTHGEVQASVSLQKKIQDRFGWNVVIPHRMESFELP